VKVSGERSFAAPRTAVWRVLNDPAELAALMPGIEGFDVHDDRHWQARVKIPLGLGGLKLTIDFEKTEEQEPDFAALNAKGKGVGALLAMQTRFDLAETDGTTAMRWEADVRLGGQVASMGLRVLQPIVNQQVGNVLKALDERVQAAAANSHPA
jgi:carbon monoxide dehydrogenase subunit G